MGPLAPFCYIKLLKGEERSKFDGDYLTGKRKVCVPVDQYISISF